MDQKTVRRGIIVDGGLTAVTSVAGWYRAGHFKSDDEARGAFKLAYQQAMDGMGKSIPQWMGLSDEEFDAWMRHGTLPVRHR